MFSGFQCEEAAPQYLPLHWRQGPQGVCGEFTVKATNNKLLPPWHCYFCLYFICNTLFLFVSSPIFVYYHVYVLSMCIFTSLWGLWLVDCSGGGAVKAELFSRGGDAGCGVHKGDGEVGITACIPLPCKYHITKVKLLHTGFFISVVYLLVCL